MGQEEVKIDALTALSKIQSGIPAIDVRSQGEFGDGSIPGFISLPILTDEERHQVGKRYKDAGQEAAIRLGERLTEPHRASRTLDWIQATKGHPEVVLTCWRGGLRSQIASEWIRTHVEAPKVFRVSGGYKAMRGELLKKLEGANLPELWVISGNTGSGKSRLLEKALGENLAVLDLEKHAQHRGSAFGNLPGHRQPSQATFENRTALELLQPSPRRLVEDESTCVGSVHVPLYLKKKMDLSPLVIVRESLEVRTRLIFEDYLEAPIHAGFSQDALQALFIQSLESIRKRLGHEATDRNKRQMLDAFTIPLVEKGRALEKHAPWIQSLLVDYYDRRYEYDRIQRPRKTLFEGTAKECLEWLKQHFHH
ncbi:MAG: tRNA 2-selenouridine(34) synthase MnmH [Bdellovibrionales bacterium]|nr:tRNA 2-selenouridine(34) synthase MnmH [Bdellovibrionales bacterium]